MIKIFQAKVMNLKKITAIFEKITAKFYLFYLMYPKLRNWLLLPQITLIHTDFFHRFIINLGNPCLPAGRCEICGKQKTNHKLLVNA